MTNDSASKQPLDSSHWDKLSIGSFIVAAGLSAATLCNNIRQKFYNSFVKPTYPDLIAEYDGGRHSERGQIDGEFKENRKIFEQACADKKNGVITNEKFNEAAKTYRTEMSNTAKKMRTDIATRVLEDHNIPTYGRRGWTEGIVKRWQNIGKHGRMDAGLGFAAVTAMGIGAAFTIRHSKHTLDHIEQRLNAQESASRQ